jgi:hypothetical protein
MKVSEFFDKVDEYEEYWRTETCPNHRPKSSAIPDEVRFPFGVVEMNSTDGDMVRFNTRSQEARNVMHASILWEYVESPDEERRIPIEARKAMFKREIPKRKIVAWEKQVLAGRDE